MQDVNEDGEESKDDFQDPVRNARDVYEKVSDLLVINTKQSETPSGEQNKDATELLHEIRIRLREKARGENTDTLIQGRAQAGQSHGSRREKERIIGEVVIKVSEWRRLYTEQGVTLENAAQRIGISKKSLDDYFL